VYCVVFISLLKCTIKHSRTQVILRYISVHILGNFRITVMCITKHFVTQVH